MLRSKSDPIDEGRETQTITDEQIVTERKVARRSFLTVAGTLLAGGALAIASGARAASQEPDSDAKPEKKDDDADMKKETSSKSSKKSKKSKGAKDSDADKMKQQPAPPQ